jgi:ABC-2 type transport system ATP-binding protein
MGAIIQVDSLEKRFGDLLAVDGVSFSVDEGEIFGLLGPNGAGKTTAISMLSCLIAPDGGDARIAGSSVRTEPLGVKRVLGVVPQEIALYPTLSAVENLKFFGRMYGLKGAALARAVDEGLELAGLGDQAKRQVETYSGGMKRRVNIAAGVLHKPRVLLMDEPTVGIDPQSRNHILETVKGLREAGMTVIYTSHYMEEVEFLCDRVGIIDHGKLIALGTKDELQATVGDADVLDISLEGDSAERADGALEAIRSIAGVTTADHRDDAIEVLTSNGGAVLGEVVSVLNASGLRLSAVRLVEPNLESVFLNLTGKSLRD